MNPPVKRADFLTGVSCTSTSACVAVGWYYYGPEGARKALAEIWNGSEWKDQALPAAARDGTLNAISCASSHSCTAVGSEIIGWNGRTWRVERQHASFDAVSCPAPSGCVATGETPAGKEVAGFEADGTWRASRLAALPRHGGAETLAGLSCWAPGGCLAVGSYSDGAGAQPNPAARTRNLAERWNGRRWTALRVRNVAHVNQLFSVSCTGPRQCVAVGQAGGQMTLAESWNGTGWRHERTPDFGKAGLSEFTAVSCTSPARCIALGDLNLGKVYSEIYNGTTWQVRRVPVPHAIEPAVGDLALSCTGTGCEMAGTLSGETLAESWNGSTWLLQATPDPR